MSLMSCDFAHGMSPDIEGGSYNFMITDRLYLVTIVYTFTNFNERLSLILKASYDSDNQYHFRWATSSLDMNGDIVRLGLGYH